MQHTTHPTTSFKDGNMPLTVQSDTERALHRLLARAGTSTADVQPSRLADIDEILEFVCDAPPSTFIGFGGQPGLPIDAAIDKAIAGMSALALGHHETATMRAALEFWQREGQGSSGHEHDIAAAGGSLQPLGADEIAQLVARLAGSAEAGPIDKASDSEVNRARRLYANDNVQIDDGARASRGDGITWVEAWVALEEQCHE